MAAPFTRWCVMLTLFCSNYPICLCSKYFWYTTFFYYNQWSNSSSMHFVDANGNYPGRSCCWWAGPLSSAEVVSKVISPDSSNSTFFKNAGLSTHSLKPLSAVEQSLLEELAAQKQKEAAITEEFDEVSLRSEAAEEALLKTQQLYDEMKKQQEDNNLVLQRIL